MFKLLIILKVNNYFGSQPPNLIDSLTVTLQHITQIPYPQFIPLPP